MKKHLIKILIAISLISVNERIIARKVVKGGNSARKVTKSTVQQATNDQKKQFRQLTSKDKEMFREVEHIAKNNTDEIRKKWEKQIIFSETEQKFINSLDPRNVVKFVLNNVCDLQVAQTMSENKGTNPGLTLEKTEKEEKNFTDIVQKNIDKWNNSVKKNLEKSVGGITYIEALNKNIFEKYAKKIFSQIDIKKAEQIVEESGFKSKIKDFFSMKGQFNATKFFAGYLFSSEFEKYHPLFILENEEKKKEIVSKVYNAAIGILESYQTASSNIFTDFAGKRINEKIKIATMKQNGDKNSNATVKANCMIEIVNQQIINFCKLCNTKAPHFEKVSGKIEAVSNWKKIAGGTVVAVGSLAIVYHLIKAFQSEEGAKTYAKNMYEHTKEGAKKLGSTIREKANKLGSTVKEKAKQFGSYLKRDKTKSTPPIDNNKKSEKSWGSDDSSNNIEDHHTYSLEAERFEDNDNNDDDNDDERSEEDEIHIKKSNN